MTEHESKAVLRPRGIAVLAAVSLVVGVVLGQTLLSGGVASDAGSSLPAESGAPGDDTANVSGNDAGLLEIVVPGEGSIVVRRVRLDVLTEAALAEVRAAPESISALYARGRAELVAALGPRFADLREAELQYVFTTAVSYWMAPYGSGGGATLAKILEAETLQCAAYGPLAWHLFERCRGGVGDEQDDLSVSFVGWDGGRVFNHQQTFIARRDGTAGFLLDPTVALIARAGFDEVASGRPIDREDIVILGDREDVAYARMRVVDALVRGKYRPSDLLYYYEDAAHLLDNPGSPFDWPTPGAVDWRERRRAN